MEINSRLEGANVLVLELREGNLDASNVREFKDAASALLQGHTCVVLDMSAVKFVDSSGLGALISCVRQLNSRRGDFRLCEMQKAVRALFELMRMHHVFSIHETRQDAVQSFAQPQKA